MPRSEAMASASRADEGAAREALSIKSRLFLDIGDEFALQTLPARGADKHVIGFVTARDGVTVDFLDGTDMDLTNPPHPHECRFQLHTPHQFVASKALRKARKTLGTSKEDIQALETASDSERQRNEAEFKLRSGQQAIFGSVVQMYSPTSNSFLQAEKTIAREENTALECSVGSSKYRAKTPWFRIMPGFATRNEGDRIRMGDTIILESIKTPQTFVHCNHDNVTPGATREVNISATPSRFQIVPVAKFRDLASSGTTVRGGDFLQLYQRQSQSYLYRDRDDNPVLYRPATDAQTNSDSAQVSDRECTRADLTFGLEMPMMKWSGSSVRRQKYTQQYFSLKDAMSGRFLLQQSDGSIVFSDNDDTPMAHWELKSFDKDTTYFEFGETTFLIQNRATRTIMHRKGRQHVKSVSSGPGKTDKKAKTPGVVSETEPGLVAKDGAPGQMFSIAGIDEGRVHQDDLFICRPLANSRLKNFLYLQHNIRKLVRFEDQVRKCIAERESKGLKLSKKGTDAEKWVGKKQILDTDIEDLVRVHMRHSFETGTYGPAMSVVVDMLMKISVSQDSNVLTRDGLVDPAMQEMLSEFRVIPLLLRLINTVLDLVPRIHIVNCTYGPEMLHFIRCVFRILRMMAKDNEETSMILHGELDQILYHLGSPFSIADVISEIFSGSFDLIRKCGREFISQIWTLATEQREPQYINFLCVLLEHDHRPIKFNQDTIIGVVSTGLPSDFFRRREADSHELSHQELDLVTADEEEIKAALGEETDAQRKDREARVKDFLFHVAFIKMAGFLCSGRHRDSIDFFLRQSQFGFTYNGILAFVTSSAPYQLRDAYATLMLRLFVDREPFELCAPVQKSRVLPTINIQKLGIDEPKRVNPYADLPDVEPPTHNFSDLKDAILEVLTANAGHVSRTEVAKNQFACAILDLAQQLLLCGVYDNVSDLSRHSDGVLLLGEEGKRLGTALLPLLDGRLDDDNDPKTSRFDYNLANTTVMFMKRRILEVMNTLFAMRASSRIAAILETFYAEAVPRTPRASATSNKQSFDTEPKEKAGLPDDTARFSNPLSIDDDDNLAFDVEPGSATKLASKTEVYVYDEPVFDGSWGSLSPRSRTTNEEKMAHLALETIKTIRVFPEEHDERLTDILVDLLRYTWDPELGFRAFNTLIMYLSQYYTFSQALREVTVLGTLDAATSFMSAVSAVSEFRRLRKWLHLEKECRQCIELAKGQLSQYCDTFEGQNLLRNLNFEEYICRVLLMRLDTPGFQELMAQSLMLVEKFCLGNEQNQMLMASHMDEIFNKLLWDQNYVDAAASCVRAIVTDNSSLSQRLGAPLMDAVVALVKSFGRRLSLIRLLEKLLFVEGKPLPEMQIEVCKRAIMSKDLLEVSARLDQDEWGAGPSRDRVSMLATIFKYNETTADASERNLYRRCRCEAEYYAQSMLILSQCASGKNPTTELLCASLLPFSEVIERLHEIFDHPDLQQTEEDVTGIKNCTVCFLRDVFVDTNSTNILRALQRSCNGIWSLDKDHHADFAEPVAWSIIGDMQELQACADSSGRCSITTNHRRYLFEQAIMFFIHYAQVMPFNDVAKEEAETVKTAYKKIGSLMLAAKQESNRFWTKYEAAALEQLYQISVLWPDRKPIHSLERLNSIGPLTSDQSDTVLTHVEQTWSAIVESLVANMDVRCIDKTDRAVGQGIMRVAKALWQVLPGSYMHRDSEPTHYASFLIKPLNAELDKILKTSDLSNVPKLLTMLDAARAIPYALSEHVDSSDKMDTTKSSFLAFVTAQTLDCTANPDIARVQRRMTKQGWGLLCLKILDSELLAQLHLCALRLMIALTGGGLRIGNIEVQDHLLRQIENTPREMCAGALRRMLRAGLTDLKRHRKLAAEKERAKLLELQFHGSTSVHEKGHATETLTLIMNMCLGSHRGMQDYILCQPGHPRDLNLVADVVTYLNQAERDTRSFVTEWGADGNFENQTVPVLEQCFASLRILIAVCSGPNHDAQMAVCDTEIISIVNRMLSYCTYKHRDLVACGEHSPKRTLVALIGRLLVTLLEGEPPVSVINSIRRRLNWIAWGTQLQILRQVMEDGTIPKVMEDGTITHDNELDQSQEVPHEDRTAAWISGDAFKLMEVIDKTTYGARALLREEDSSHYMVKPHIEPLISDAKTLEYFHQRLGEVEVIGRDGQLERLFFWMPAIYMDKDKRREIEKAVLNKMDEASRESDEDKLHDFVDGCMDIVSLILQESKVKNDKLQKLHHWITGFSAGDSVLYFSFLASLVCIFAYVPAGQGDPVSDGKSLNKATYLRWKNLVLDDSVPELWALFQLLSGIHMFVCLLAFHDFTSVRIPVMLQAHTRQQRAHHLKREGISEADRKQFFAQTVYAFGFPDSIANEEALTKLFTHHGVVAGVKVVKVTGAVNSWAIVNFSSISAVHSIMHECQKNMKSADGADGEHFIYVNHHRTVRNRGSAVSIKIEIKEVDADFVHSTGGYLARLVNELEYEVTSSSESSVGYIAAANLQALVNHGLGPIGRNLPIQSMFILRSNRRFWEAMLDIAFSVTGFFTSPICLSWHLYRVKDVTGASIVLQSIWYNLGRIGITLLLALLSTFYFAIIGLLYFRGEHQADTTLTEGGPCDNLLSCFVSYSMAGLTNEGLMIWLELPTIPQEFSDLGHEHTGRIFWETAFMLVSSAIIIAIITGIICDTFGELRLQQDEAARYRSTTCFITGIPFSKVMPEKSTNHLQYAFLLLHLRTRKKSHLTPSEEHVYNEILHCSVDWLPNGRCHSLQEQSQEEAAMENSLKEMKTLLADINSRLVMMELTQGELKTELGAMAGNSSEDNEDADGV